VQASIYPSSGQGVIFSLSQVKAPYVCLTVQGLLANNPRVFESLAVCPSKIKIERNAHDVCP